MKLVFLDALTLGEDIALGQFEQFGEVVKYDTTAKEERVKHIGDADIVLTNKVMIDKEIMDQTSIKLVCVLATGTNNVDLEYAKEKGVVVKNAVGYSTHSVIQHTFATLFYLIEQMPYYDEFVKSGAWSKSPIFTNVARPFFEIAGKKWGIIGLGEIGRGVAGAARAFGCEVCYYSTSGVNREERYQRMNLDTLLAACDIISIHAPLNDKTRNLIDREKLELLKEGSVLLNLGRGGIVNEKDLVEVLKTKELFMGLDVVEVEPMQPNSPLHQLSANEKVCITPHIAWASKEARERLIEITVANVHEFLS
jgi:glycerate dehydrogenase